MFRVLDVGVQALASRVQGLRLRFEGVGPRV